MSLLITGEISEWLDIELSLYFFLILKNDKIAWSFNILRQVSFNQVNMGPVPTTLLIESEFHEM